MTMTLISAAELAERLGGADLRVFDVRHDLMNHAAGRQAWRPAISPAPATSITRPSWPPPHGQERPPPAAVARGIRRADGRSRRHAADPGGGL